MAEKRLHNIHPDALFRILSRYKTKYRFVTVDEYVVAKDRRHLAALTFDDGYASVFKEGLPVLENLNIPCTIFLNGHTVQGGLFWRDKIRWLIKNGLEKPWLDFSGNQLNLSVDRLYVQTKQPRCNSRFIDQSINAFIANLAGDIAIRQDGFTTDGMLPDHPLVHYGNHGHHHYMLSSLSQEEQEAEILQTRALLAEKSVKPPSKLFSLPFGTRRSYDDAVLNLLQHIGYRGALLSSRRIGGKVKLRAGFSLVSRWYVPQRVLHA